MTSISETDDQFVQAIAANQLALTAYCRARILNVDDAAEVLQQVNLKLWEKRDDWSPTTEFLPWAFTVARYTVLAFFRDLSRDRHVFDSDVCELMAQPSEVAVGDVGNRSRALQECLKNVPAKDVSLLDAHYVLKQPLKQIADEAGRSHGAIKALLFRIRRILARCIDSRLKVDGAAT